MGSCLNRIPTCLCQSKPPHDCCHRGMQSSGVYLRDRRQWCYCCSASLDVCREAAWTFRLSYRTFGLFRVCHCSQERISLFGGRTKARRTYEMSAAAVNSVMLIYMHHDLHFRPEARTFAPQQPADDSLTECAKALESPVLQQY